MDEKLTSHTAWALTDAIRGLMQADQSSIVQLPAIVADIDGAGYIWVRLLGANDKTPVNGTVLSNVAPGDLVHVSIADGKLNLLGNASDPSVGKTLVDTSIEQVENHFTTVLTESLIQADVVQAQRIEANYARIDAANITSETVQNSWINALMVQTGLIAKEGTVYTLDAIQVNASNITAGTIDVERLIVTVGGEKYMVHVDPTTLSPTYEKLDGNVIEDLTITADKIVAGAITADKITANNLVGTGGWINLHNGTFAYVNAATGDGISWDGSHLSIGAASQIGGVSAENIAKVADQLQYDHTYVYDSATETYTFTASVYRAGIDITSNFDDGYFVWYLKTEADTTLLGHCKTMTVQASSALYTGTVIGALEDSVDYPIVDNFVTGIVTAGGDDIIARVLAQEV